MTQDRLYNLLPAVYRSRDAELGEPLRGLMAVLESQYDTLEGDITGLYEDWFIETCAEWVVPYIADLLGLQGIEPSLDGEFSQRAFVANTLAYRRRKGTVPVIEQIGRDLASQPAKAIEYFKRLSVTQQLNHVQLRRQGTAHIRPSWGASLAHTAFEELPHLAEVRRIASTRGRYNIPNVGIHLWRAKSFWLEDVDAFKVGPGRFLFDPIGREMPLFNRERTELGLDDSPLPSQVPEPLAWRPLYDELTDLRSGLAQDVDGVYFGNQPVLQVAVNGIDVAPEDTYIASLEPWRKPSRGIAVDVVRGRLALSDQLNGDVTVSFSHGWPGEVGAMPYDRRRLQPPNDWQGVATRMVPTNQFPDINAVIATWDPDVDRRLLIRVSGNITLTGDIVIDKTKGSLRIEADNATRPVIAGSVQVPANSGLESLELDGFLISGALDLSKSLEKLDLFACTVWPTALPSIKVDAANLQLLMTLRRCFVGCLALPRDMAGLTLEDCLVDGRLAGFAIRSLPGNQATDYGPVTSMSRCTVIGAASIKQGTLISESILTDLVRCERVQTGCTRFSYVPFGSRVPRRFHCQPYSRYDELRIALVAKLGRPLTAGEDAEVTAQAARETVPRFVTLVPTSEAYLQLIPDGPCQIAFGAEDEGEMGGWHALHEVRRLRHLSGALSDYVRFGLEAGVFRSNKH